MILPLLALLASGQSTGAADPIAAALAGVFAEVEDDVLPDTNAPIERVERDGCTTRLIGGRHVWSIDWRAARTLALEDSFVFIDAPPIRLAVVMDASSPAKRARLVALHAGMADRLATCSAQ